MNKKDVFIVVLIIVCLTAMIFIVLPLISARVNVVNFPLDENGNLKTNGHSPLQNYTDAVTIYIFDASRTVNGTEDGVPTVSINLNLAFSPKQKFLNVTRFIIDFVPYQEATGWHNVNYDMELNDQPAVVDHFEALDYYPSFRTAAVTDSNILASVKPGLNSVHLNFDETVFLLKVDVTIEYAYQA